MLKDIGYQRRAIKILQGTIKKERIPSAILMYGQKGVGKRLTAINYAKAINCYSAEDFDCCDKCLSCRKIEGGVHPDIHFVEATDGEIKIDAIRKIEEFLSLKPFEGKKKVVIIDDAERMNANAFNAQLKTLEEPPPNSLLILITSNEDALPLTIRSRCIQIPFYPVPSVVFKELISSFVFSKDIELYTKMAMGRPWLAVKRNFREDKKWFLDSLQDMMSNNDVNKEIWDDNGKMKYWFDLFLVLLRDIIVYRITEDKDATILGEIFSCDSPFDALKAFDQLQEVYAKLDFNLNRAITWNYVSGIVKSLITP